MDDRVVVAAAMAAAGAALAAPGVRPAVWLVVAAVATSVFLGVGARSSGSRRGPTGSPGGVPTSARGMALAALLAALVGVRADQDLGGLDRPLPKEVAGIAELGSDPRRSDLGTRVELVAGGRRYLAEFDRDSEAAVADLRTGDRLAVRGAPRPLRGAPQGWVRARHLSGRLRVDAVGPGGPTRPWFRAANAVHELLHRGSRSMSSGHRALYAGLVVGDDRGQDEVTRFRFRASGLAHLLAVSGQNLVFVLAVLSPLRSRLGFRWRWVLGVAAVGGFVLVTRAEPSVLRAAVMAVLGLTAAAGGRRIPGVRLVATAVVLLLLGDPLLVHSVGFRLSVAATLGLVLLAGPLGRLVPGPGWLARPLAVTVAAQAGAVPVMAATFGAVSVLAVPANLAAEPAAGAVMTLGLTSGLVAGAVREEVAGVLQAPVRVSVWWVDTVASAAAGLSAPPVGVGGWLAVVGGAGLAVGLWRVRGARGLGRCALVAIVPWVALVRPPLPERSEVAVLPGDALAVPRCGSWHLVLGEQGADEHAAAEVLEALWGMGLGRVATVAAPEGSGDDAAALAAVLGAHVVPWPPEAGKAWAGEGSAACVPARPRSPP